MAQIHAVRAALAVDRTMAHREDDRFALAQRYDLGARLAARALLGQHEFPARKIDSRSAQQDRRLQRKDEFPVDVLMQAVVIVDAVAKQEGLRAIERTAFIARCQRAL